MVVHHPVAVAGGAVDEPAGAAVHVVGLRIRRDIADQVGEQIVGRRDVARTRAGKLRRPEAVRVGGTDAQSVGGRNPCVVVRFGVIALQLISELDVVLAARIAAVVGQVVGVGEPALRAEGVHGVGEEQAAEQRGAEVLVGQEQGRRQVEPVAHLIGQIRFGHGAPNPGEQLHFVVVAHVRHGGEVRGQVRPVEQVRVVGEGH